ncbi:MAG: class I poly(R)-hydroxyalkanoic acid synthase [Proteobacteria bacterium]|nr:class I poly(R)-hydroxyalkanoic acid synthase [Pseudomonadota bacterium]
MAKAATKTKAKADAPKSKAKADDAKASKTSAKKAAKAESSTPKGAKAAKAAKALTTKPAKTATPKATAQKSAPAESPRPAAAKPASAPPPQPAAAPPPAARMLEMLSAEQRENLERMSMNLARAALTAQGAIAEAALRQADRPAALSPDPFHVAPALNEVMGRLAGEPDRLMRAQADLFNRYMELWRSTAQRAAGEEHTPAATPAKGDKRFLDPDWSHNPVFDVIKQSYLITSDWLNDLVGGVDGVDPLTKRRVEFFTRMLTDAMSPSNFLMTNPAALREAMATQGDSIAKGMANFAADLERGGGQLSISQTDFTQFKVGENVATAPGKVIFQNEIIQILQFDPTTETVCEIPLLIFPPWINKFYIMDLRPENSMIRWLSSQGITVFVTSWVNPDQRLATKTMEDYLHEGIYAAIDAVTKQANVKTVNTVGYCIGGTLLSCALAHMAAKGDDRVASATFFAAQQDFSEAGDLLIFTNEDWLKDLEGKMDAGGGVLPGQTMADTFNALRSNDLIWSFFVSNYLMGKEPKPFDLLFWNADQTRMPKTLHLFYLRKFYGENALARGELVLDNVRLNLKDVKTPIYVQSSKEDHIAPLRSVYKGAKLFGGPVTFTMAGSGHIAGVINAPVAKKYQHWTNAALPDTIDQWIAGSVEHPGSWWPHWAEWLKARSGKQVPARDPSKGPLKPIEDAPGSFVKVRS